MDAHDDPADTLGCLLDAQLEKMNVASHSPPPASPVPVDAVAAAEALVPGICWTPGDPDTDDGEICAHLLTGIVLRRAAQVAWKRRAKQVAAMKARAAARKATKTRARKTGKGQGHARGRSL